MKKSVKSKNKLSKKGLNKVSGGMEVISEPVDPATKKPYNGFEPISPGNYSKNK
ncbi:hypothetical protein [Legionella jamestowniensis]|uniref:Uncharacterized protein n=1 Tax=Legionella jamestowniensis TaxID=455 RepID=A0A0W0ULR5_9GAMM|nr:hypothetical protein [Legionella jamestowniensis]KTD08700.1 hypothetical protein Ljam_2895 [Legionella jamestowniensis]SFL55220.1 hypothetical protein SAMN02746073_0846 [Legionella jamestowniensis DSM 19215]